MNKLPQISEAEYEVMKVVWKYEIGRASCRERVLRLV